MAIGDKATAKGLQTWTSAQDRRLGYQNDNQRGDDIALYTAFAAGSAALRDAFWGVPANATDRLALQNLCATTNRLDTGWTERYYANKTDGGSNPAGVAIAGWYPTTEIHAEYAWTQTAVANGTPTNLATLPVLDAAASSAQAAAFFTPALTGLTLILPGRYEAGGTMAVPVASTGRSFFTLTIGTAKRNEIGPGGDSLSIGGMRRATVAANGALLVDMFQTTTAARTLTGRLEIDWLGPLV